MNSLEWNDADNTKVTVLELSIRMMRRIIEEYTIERTDRGLGGALIAMDKGIKDRLICGGITDPDEQASYKVYTVEEALKELNELQDEQDLFESAEVS